LRKRLTFFLDGIPCRQGTQSSGLKRVITDGLEIEFVVPVQGGVGEDDQEPAQSHMVSPLSLLTSLTTGRRSDIVSGFLRLPRFPHLFQLGAKRRPIDTVFLANAQFFLE